MSPLPSTVNLVIYGLIALAALTVFFAAARRAGTRRARAALTACFVALGAFTAVAAASVVAHGTINGGLAPESVRVISTHSPTDRVVNDSYHAAGLIPGVRYEITAQPGTKTEWPTDPAPATTAAPTVVTFVPATTAMDVTTPVRVPAGLTDGAIYTDLTMTTPPTGLNAWLALNARDLTETLAVTAMLGLLSLLVLTAFNREAYPAPRVIDATS